MFKHSIEPVPAEATDRPVRPVNFPVCLLLALALALVACAVSAEQSASSGQPGPSRLDAAANFTLHGAAEVFADGPRRGLELHGDAYAEWRPKQDLTNEAGSLEMWVKPLWAQDDRQSHPFATFKWSGSDESYFSLSQGWWEPQGQGKLYVVLSNQQFVFCLMPWKFDYTLYLANQWTMLAVTWQSGASGFVRLYVDGTRVCERRMAFSGNRQAADPVYLGSDIGAGVEHRGRSADVAIRDVLASAHPLTDEEVHRAFLRGDAEGRRKWIIALAPDDAPPLPAERRIIQDEDTGWASSKLEIQKRVQRIKTAGFNIYSPCVWDGAHAFFNSLIGPVAVGVRDPIDPQYDPLKYLISLAHQEGIAVHPWFDIARHPSTSQPMFPQSFVAGAPSEAFNVHNTAFRSYIVSLVSDAAERYDVDGINLDYVRAIGPCTNPECVEEYSRKYHRALAEDWKSQERGETIPSLIEWNRAAMGDILARISSSVRRSKPHTAITIDTVPFSHERLHQGVDDQGWLRSGIIDAMIDMEYDDPIDIATVDQAVKTFGAASQVIDVRNYDIFGDTVMDRPGVTMADYVRLIRTRWPGAGIAFYHYPHLSPSQIKALKQDVFENDAAAEWAR